MELGNTIGVVEKGISNIDNVAPKVISDIDINMATVQ